MKKLLSVFIVLIFILSSVPVFSIDSTPAINVYMTNPRHDIIHSAAGFLYGISNEGVPDVNTLTPLKPKVLATKGALGTEHPYGDALDVAEEFFQAGGEQVQMYCSNYYGVFGVTANANDYGKVLEEIIAPHVYDWKDSVREKYPDIDERIVYIPINEGTPVNGVANFNEAWRIYYNSIKKVDPNAFIAGPNDAVYRGHNGMYDFLKYCRDNNCLPQIISWHELQVNCLDTMDDHIADYRSICRDLGIEEVQVVINEYADYSDCGVPGRLVNWIARLEENGVYGCLPFWHQANNLNDLAANSNDGNGAWWVYKWYGDMSGKILNLSNQNSSFDGFYGLACIDDNKKSATVICGGNDKNGVINLKNIDKTSVFKNVSFVSVKVEASRFTGYHGASGEGDVIMEGVFPIENGNVTINLSDMLFSTAYRLTITPTDKDKTYEANRGFFKSYEAEDATFFGPLIVENEGQPLETPRYFCSGRVRIGGIDREGEGIEYKISVPYDGLYKLQFLYGNGVGSTRNNAATHAPKNITQKLIIDGNEEIISLPNTLFYSMEGIAEKYVSLTEGSHSISLMYNGKGGAFHDCLYVSSAGAFNAPVPSFDKVYEAESFDFNPESLCVTESTLPSYSGSGYVTGIESSPVYEKGGIRQIVRVPQSGLYAVSFKYISDAEGSLSLYLDNTNLTFTNHLTDIPVEECDEWQNAHTTIFLRQGLNIIDIGSDVPVYLDSMRVIASNVSESVIFEAEDSLGTFSVAEINGTVYTLPLEGSKAARETDYLEFTVDAPTEGLYKMQIFQSNDELCGTHSYNIKIIDRYATIEVNGDKENAKRYFFPNSFSEASFIEKTVPVTLDEGENTIRIYNDDSWQVLWGGSQSTPGTNELENYTPNFDKFIITPAVVDAPLPEEQLNITISSTQGGIVYTDKTYAAPGEEVNVYVIPRGITTSLLVNGEEFLGNLQTTDGNIYYTSFTLLENTEIFAAFSQEVSSGTPAPEENNSNIIIDGEAYVRVGGNLFKNGDFSDPSGNDMNQWFTGVNTSGHPSSSLYQKPLIKSDGTYENLTLLNESGLLTTGGYEIDNPDTFYFGKDNSSSYLVEHMASDWQHCAWNGDKSLLAFVKIKENTDYTFSFRAFSVSGKASVRYGAIDMDSFIPPDYNTSGSLNFASSEYFDCTNGDVQNVGGSWSDYKLNFNSGDGEYFLFNAYWLQMAEYLCLGDFELYELEKASSLIESPSSPEPLVFLFGETVSLPSSIKAFDENNNELTLAVSWVDQIPSSSDTGVYYITGKLSAPEGYRLSEHYISQKITITKDLCEIYSWEKSEEGLTFLVKGYSDCTASLIVAEYSSEALIATEIIPIELKKGLVTEASVSSEGPLTVFVWDKTTLVPLCSVKKVN